MSVLIPKIFVYGEFFNNNIKRFTFKSSSDRLSNVVICISRHDSRDLKRSDSDFLKYSTRTKTISVVNGKDHFVTGAGYIV